MVVKRLRGGNCGAMPCSSFSRQRPVSVAPSTCSRPGSARVPVTTRRR